MPASHQPRVVHARLALALAVGGLLAVAAPATPATAAPPVAVDVRSTGADNPAYQIDVRNDSGATVETTLRQELPPGAAPVSISDGGRAATPQGQTNGTEVSWRLRLAVGGTATVHTELARTPPDVPVTAPVCAFAGDGELPYDCASATWNPTKAGAATATPLWRRPSALLVGLAGLLLIAGAVAGWAWWRRRREQQSAAGQGGEPAAGPRAPGAGGTFRRPAGRRLGRLASGGAVYRAGSFGGPRLIRDEPPAQPGGGAAGGPVGPGGNLIGGLRRSDAPPKPPGRSRPPTWLAVALAALLAAGLAVTVIATASTQVTAMSAGQEPSSGAWIGRTVAGQVGAPLRDSAFEFTVYRLTCPNSAGGAPATGGAGTAAPPTEAVPAVTAGAGLAADGGRCRVTLGLHNVSGREQYWDGTLQRAYLPGGDWVTADETATLAANAGRDYFAAPVPPDERLVFPLVFTLPGTVAPTRIELRSEVFSAGVSVQVPR